MNTERGEGRDVGQILTVLHIWVDQLYSVNNSEGDEPCFDGRDGVVDRPREGLSWPCTVMDRQLNFDCLLSDHVVVTNLGFMTSKRKVVQFVDAFVALHKRQSSYLGLRVHFYCYLFIYL